MMKSEPCLGRRRETFTLFSWVKWNLRKYWMISSSLFGASIIYEWFFGIALIQSATSVSEMKLQMARRASFAQQFLGCLQYEWQLMKVFLSCRWSSMALKWQDSRRFTLHKDCFKKEPTKKNRKFYCGAKELNWRGKGFCWIKQTKKRIKLHRNVCAAAQTETCITVTQTLTVGESRLKNQNANGSGRRSWWDLNWISDHDGFEHYRDMSNLRKSINHFAMF